MQSHTPITGYEYVLFEIRRQSQLKPWLPRAYAPEARKGFGDNKVRVGGARLIMRIRTPFDAVKVNDGGGGCFRKRSKRR